ncbi:hypothetical protein STEG23_012217, partial [Scotinomys teguina]
MARKAGQGKEEEESRARQQREKTPTCDGRGHHVVEQEPGNNLDAPQLKNGLRKMWYIYTMEYYSAEKNNDIMKFAYTLMELENITLSEVTQTQKDKHGQIFDLQLLAGLQLFIRNH